MKRFAGERGEKVQQEGRRKENIKQTNKNTTNKKNHKDKKSTKKKKQTKTLKRLEVQRVVSKEK